MPDDTSKEDAPEDASKEDTLKEDAPKEDETEEARQRRCAGQCALDDRCDL